MPKVYLDEINAALSSNTFSVLDSDANDASTLQSALIEFTDYSSGDLSGSQWDKYRSKMSQFGEAMKERAALAAKLGAAIKEALELLRDYMGEDLMLDSSKLEEYKYQRQICENSIQTLNVMMNEKVEEQYLDANGNEATRYVPVYNSNEVRSQLSLANDTLRELDRLIAKIEGLDAVYQQAEAILSSAFSDLDGFKSRIADIVPDGKFQYHAA